MTPEGLTEGLREAVSALQPPPRPDEVRSRARRRRQHRRATLATTLAAALVGGVVALTVTLAGGPGDAGSISAGANAGANQARSPAASAKAAARREAERLLALLVPPPGASPVSSLPRLARPGIGTPASSQLLDRGRVWLLSMSFQAAEAYIAAHPPAGLTPSVAGSSGGTAGTVTAFRSWSAHSTGRWRYAQAAWTVAALSGGRVGLRADGEDVWVNPTPTADTAPGPRVRLTTTTACPARAADVTNPGRGLTTRLLPVGRPTGGVVCWYDGLSASHPSRVALGAPAVARLARSVQALPLGSIGIVVTNCPDDTGGVALVALAYPRRPDVDLRWATSGCQSVDNGRIVTPGSLPLHRPVLARPL